MEIIAAALHDRSIFGIEGALWATFLLALTAHLGRVLADRLRDPWAVAAIALGVALRALHRFVPRNWYLEGFTGPDDPLRFYSRSTGRQALVDLWALAAHPHGIFWLHAAMGVLCVPLLGHALRRAGHSDAVVRVVELLVAGAPIFVRLTTTDASQVTILFLFAACASAFFSLASSPSRDALATIVLATGVLALPIRVETGFGVCVVPLLGWHRHARWRDVLWRGRASRIHAAGVAVGATLAVLGPTQLTRPGLASALMGSATVLLAWPSVSAVVPVGLMVPVAWVIARALRAGRAGRGTLARYYVPWAAASLPFLLGKGVIVNAVEGAYHLTRIVFLVVMTAMALEDLGSDGALRSRLRHTVLSVLVLGSTLVVTVALRNHLFAYQEEYLFLDEELAKVRPGDVWAVVDVELRKGSDADCCLVLPHPELSRHYPDVHWKILRRGDALPDGVHDAGVFYAGSMAQIDPAASEAWSAWTLARFMKVDTRPQRDEAAAHALALWSLGKLKSQFPRPIAVRVTSANTFSHARFEDDRMTLGLWGHEGGDARLPDRRP